MNTCPNPLLKLEGLSKSYGDKKVIEEIHLHLQQGELVSLLGTSGVGKTTLFHLIAGLTCPDSGRVLLDGQDITGQSGKISYMLQKDLLLPYKTLEENIALPLLLKGTKKSQALDMVQSHLPRFGLEGYGQYYPKALSGGMCQRAALLRTYLFSDSVALLDEPFSALDSLTKGDLQQWYLSIMADIKLSTLFITHDMDEAIFLSDRIYLLCGRPGQIVAELTISSPKPRTQDFLLSPEFIQYKKEIIQIFRSHHS